MFAQMSFDATHLAAFAAILFFLVGGSNQVLKFIGSFKEQPPPAATYVTKEFCAVSHEATVARVDKLEREFFALRGQMEDMRIDLAAIISTEVGKVHSRTDDVLAAVSELRGELKRMHTSGNN